MLTKEASEEVMTAPITHFAILSCNKEILDVDNVQNFVFTLERKADSSSQTSRRITKNACTLLKLPADSASLSILKIEIR